MKKTWSQMLNEAIPNYLAGQLKPRETGDNKDEGPVVIDRLAKKLPLGCGPPYGSKTLAGAYAVARAIEEGSLRIPSPPKPEPPSVMIGAGNIEVVRFSPDGKVWLNPQLDLSQLRELPREYLLMVRALADAALAEDDVKPELLECNMQSLPPEVVQSEVDAYVALLRQVQEGKTAELKCPRCGEATVQVSFSQHGHDKFTHVNCQSCDFATRAQGS